MSFRSTPGNRLFGFRLEVGKSATWKCFASRALMESLILWIIPIFVALKIYEIRYESILFLEFTAVYYLVLCILRIILHTPVWNLPFKWRYTRESIGRLEFVERHVTLSVIFLLSLLTVMGWNNHHNPGQSKILGFTAPFKMKEYPENKKAKQHAEFIRNQQNAKDYLLGAFYTMLPGQYSRIKLQELYDGIIFNDLEESILDRKSCSPTVRHGIFTSTETS